MRGRGMTKRIPSDNRILAKHAAAICRLGKRVVADVIEIGRLLTECKHILRAWQLVAVARPGVRMDRDDRHSVHQRLRDEQI